MGVTNKQGTTTSRYFFIASEFVLSWYTQEREKLVHLPHIVQDLHEQAEVPQHDMARIRVVSKGILETIHIMNPIGLSTNL